MYVYEYIYTPLEDFNPDQQEERSSIGSPCCSCLHKTHTSMQVQAGHYFPSVLICCLGAHVCAWLSRVMNSALLLAEPGHREPQKFHSFGVSEHSNHCAAGAAVCRSPLGTSCHLTTRFPTQLMLLRIALAPLSAGQMGHILEEDIATVISGRLLRAGSLWTLTTRSELRSSRSSGTSSSLEYGISCFVNENKTNS